MGIRLLDNEEAARYSDRNGIIPSSKVSNQAREICCRTLRLLRLEEGGTGRGGAEFDKAQVGRIVEGNDVGKTGAFYQLSIRVNIDDAQCFFRLK